jgi:CRP-like cAMP-binding protein
VVVIFSQRALIQEEFGANEVIFREGELGRHLYVIKTGRVEVLAAGADGAFTRLKELGPGEHFGEMALLGNHPRNATVRTLSPTVLLKMDRGSFAALYTSLPGIQSHFNQVLESRLKELRGTEPNRATKA